MTFLSRRGGPRTPHPGPGQSLDVEVLHGRKSPPRNPAPISHEEAVGNRAPARRPTPLDQKLDRLSCEVLAHSLPHSSSGFHSRATSMTGAPHAVALPLCVRFKAPPAGAAQVLTRSFIAVERPWRVHHPACPAPPKADRSRVNSTGQLTY